MTHWGRVTQICVSKFTIIGSDNGLSPIRRQTIIWTNVGILLIRTLGTNSSEILIQIHTFLNKKMHLKMSSGKCKPFCLGLNVLSYLSKPAAFIKKFNCVPIAYRFVYGSCRSDTQAYELFLGKPSIYLIYSLQSSKTLWNTVLFVTTPFFLHKYTYSS